MKCLVISLLYLSIIPLLMGFASLYLSMKFALQNNYFNESCSLLLQVCVFELTFSPVRKKSMSLKRE